MKRIIPLLLAIVMVCTLLPMTALAAEGDVNIVYYDPSDGTSQEWPAAPGSQLPPYINRETGEPGEPTRDGYTFAGWFDSNGDSIDDYLGYTPGVGVIFNAQWTPVTTPAPDPVDPDEGGKNPERDGVQIVYDAGFRVSYTYAMPGDPMPSYGSIFYEDDDYVPVWEGHKFIDWVDGLGESISTYGGYTPGVGVIFTAVWDTDKVSKPGMDKKANLEDTIGTVKPGEEIIFTLDSHVGDDMKVVQDEDGVYTGTYTLNFHDKMTENLQFNADSLGIMVGDKTLTEDQYTLTVSPADGHTFCVSIDCVDLLNDGVFRYEDIGAVAVRVSYTATVKDTAKDGEKVMNTAFVNDSQGDTVKGDVDNKKPEPPHTGSNSALLFLVVGISVMCGGAVVFLTGSKKKGRYSA